MLLPCTCRFFNWTHNDWRTLNMVQIRARSCRVFVLRARDPSTLLSFSLTSMGPVSVRRGPLFQTTISLPAVSSPGSCMLMS